MADILEIAAHPLFLLLAVVGAGLAVVDARLIGWPVLAVAILAVIAAGSIAQVIRPFNFADGGWGLEGFLAVIAGLMASAGYLLSAVTFWLVRRHRRHA